MYKNKTADVLKALMAREGLNQAELARRAGLNQPTIQRILNRGIENPGVPTVAKLAAYFGVTVQQMVGVEPLDSKAAGAEPMLRKAKPTRMLPLISWVQAGSFCDAMDPYEPGDANEWVPVYNGASELAFVLEVRGDSMLNPYGDPSFPEGTRIIADPAVEARPGRFVIARIDSANEVTFKKLVEDAGRHYLKPLNAAYPAILVDETVRICATVTAIAQRSLL